MIEDFASQKDFLMRYAETTKKEPKDGGAQKKPVRGQQESPATHERRNLPKDQTEPSKQTQMHRAGEGQKNIFIRRQEPEKPKVAPTPPKEGKGPFDWWLFTIMITLLSVGLVMVLSSSSIVAEHSFHDKYFFFKRQVLYALLGILCLWGAALAPRRFIYKIHYWSLFATLFLLSLTLTPLAPTINGARRWISLGFASIQPMEFVKIALVLYLAYFMSSKQENVRTFWRGVFPPCFVTSLYCIILLFQPDFGSAIVLAGILFFMCIAGGIRWVYIGWSLILGGASIAILAVSAPYRIERMKAFLDPFKDPSGAGYQLIQSFYALASGGLFGVGVGASQQKMFYLPEAHNDFIMSVVGEEMGLLGMTVIMFLFACLFWRCFRIVLAQTEMRARLSCFGLTAIIAIGALTNLAVVMGMLPPKGVAMPLLSYGGSNLIATMLCIGLIMNFSRSTANDSSEMGNRAREKI